VSFPSFDGLEIPGFLLRPRDPSPERPVPAVVYPRGGPTDAYVDDWDGHAQYFVDSGYAWLAVNFRGSTGYGRTTSAPTTASGASTTQGTVSRRRTSSGRSTGSAATD
jgi:dipeptidyl aminopeptidase/acylaminoacyl peptidase